MASETNIKKNRKRSSSPARSSDAGVRPGPAGG